MAHRVWTGSSWRRISDTEARLRRKRGEQVVTDEPTGALADILAEKYNQVAPLPQYAEAVLNIEESMFELEIEPQPPNASLIVAQDVLAESLTEMSDEELERLTAPGME
jgi:hypothetical protein